jgi:excisionase family DNA binding protein
MHIGANKRRYRENAMEMQLGNSILLSKNEARRELGGVSMRTIDELIARKVLPVVRIGRRVLIRRSQLEQFAKRDQQTHVHRKKAPKDQSELQTTIQEQ